MTQAFVLPPELNIYNVVETRSALLTWVSEHIAAGIDPLEISAMNVVEVDGSGLQLLAAFANTADHWKLVDSSEAFRVACETLGYSQWLRGKI